MTATTVDRVPRHTSADVNRRIEQETADRVSTITPQTRQVLVAGFANSTKTNASALAFTGVTLGALVDKRWLVLPALVTAFLFQHAVQGWCPPVPILRRLGYRTAREIDIERAALKALRGDFGPIGPGPGDRDSRASHALQAARLSAGEQ
jgi:hypothetical protein